MKAIPTRASGYQMRSRLEATWAHFFDLIGWSWEYEPIDSDGYIPDFMVIGARPFLVEIKPAPSFAALNDARRKAVESLEGHWDGDILYLGVSPFIEHRCQYTTDLSIGVLDERGEYYDNWTTGCANFGTCWVCGNPAISHCYMDFTARPCGHHVGNPVNWHDRPDYDLYRHLWAEAKNTTQWNAPR